MKRKVLKKSARQIKKRRLRIERYLRRKGIASLEDVAKVVGISLSTVRRDLDFMAEEGIVKRTHGGAQMPDSQLDDQAALNVIIQEGEKALYGKKKKPKLPKIDDLAFASRNIYQHREKKAIGKACADLIDLNQSVIIDAGTTTYHVARALKSKTPQIITNSLPVANCYTTSASDVEVLVSGGVIYPPLGVLVGPLAIKTFSEMHVDVAVMGAGGITMDGVTNSHGLLIDIQRAMIRAAEKVIFCLDNTKFGRLSLSRLCDLSAMDSVVTDTGVSSSLLKQLQNAGVHVVLAKPRKAKSARPTPTQISP